MADKKDEVRERYGRIALSGGGCCGGADTQCCSSPESAGLGAAGDVLSTSGTVSSEEAGIAAPGSARFEVESMMIESYDSLQGYEPDADLQLGCGIPIRLAALQEGETVVDLGSGAGNDAFVARQAVGPRGKVIGLDMTPEMVERARRIADSRGFENVHFVLGDIEAMPIEERTADIVLSNCTLNLVPDKQAAFTELFRITRPGGRFCISDVVTEGTLPESIHRSVEAYVGCVAGALEREVYLDLLQAAGFVEVAIREARDIELPDSMTAGSAPDDGARVLSVTVTGTRPDESPRASRAEES